jgi:hypothetical protein
LYTPGYTAHGALDERRQHQVRHRLEQVGYIIFASKIKTFPLVFKLR